MLGQALQGVGVVGIAEGLPIGRHRAYLTIVQPGAFRRGLHAGHGVGLLWPQLRHQVGRRDGLAHESASCHLDCGLEKVGPGHRAVQPVDLAQGGHSAGSADGGIAQLAAVVLELAAAQKVGLALVAGCSHVVGHP